MVVLLMAYQVRILQVFLLVVLVVVEIVPKVDIIPVLDGINCQDGVLEVLDSFRTVAEEGVVVMAAVPQLVEVPLEL